MFVLFKYIICLVLFSRVCFADNLANEILSQAIEKYGEINCKFDLKVVKKQKSKPDKIKQYSVYVFYPNNDSLHRMIRVDTNKPLNLADVSYWEHDYHIKGKVERWFTLPLTGKLKKMKDNDKPSGDFSLNDIMIDVDDILNKSNHVMKTGSGINVIEIGGKVKQHLSIEMDTYRILKIDIFNKYNRVIKEIEFTKYIEMDGFSIPKLIEVKDKKKKIHFIATLEYFEKKDDFREEFFLPRNKNGSH